MGNNAEIKITLDAKEAEKKAKESSERMRRSEEKAGGAGGGRKSRRVAGGGGRAGAGRAAAAGAAGGRAAGTLARGALGVARGAGAAGAAAVGGGIDGLMLEQAVVKKIAESAGFANAVLKSQAARELVRSLLPEFVEEIAASITANPAFLQARTDFFDKLIDDRFQQFSLEVIRAQTARLDVAEILGPFARAGLPSGRLAKDDGSFTEGLVRNERRRMFLQRQQERRNAEGQVGVLADLAQSFLGG